MMTFSTNTAPSWQLYSTTEAIWKEMLTEIKNAQHTIYFEQFHFIDSSISQEFIKALLQKAREGVQIRCLFDSMGSFLFSQSPIPKLLEESRIQVRFFNWLFPFSKGNKHVFYFRNHRRSLIIDGRIGFTGGVCIGDYTQSWKDTQVKISGPVVAQMKAAFETAWDKAHTRTIHFSKPPVFDEHGFAYCTQAPLPRQRFIYYKLVEAIKNAQQHIYIATPYFLPDHKILRYLRKAARKGVDVHIIIPSASDHPIVDVGSRTYIHYLLKNKIKISYHSGMIHSKTAVIDEDWAMVGSLNLDNVSLRYNFESALISRHPQFCEDLKQVFMEYLNNAKELTFSDWQSRPVMRKVLEILIWPIRKLL